MMQQCEISELLFRLSDIHNIKAIMLDNAICERLFGKIILNRVANISYKNMLKNHVKLGEFSRPLKVIYDDNILRAQICKLDIKMVSRIFSEAKFPFALLKGAYLIPFLYELGDRLSNDIDVLISERSIDDCQRLLLNNGFRQGFIREGKFCMASRKEIVMSRMNYGETVPFVKEIDNRFIVVDINFSLDYKPMNDNTVIVKMLENRVNIPFDDVSLVTLNTYDFLIHLCLHLYKEATTYDWVIRRKDLSLYKFNDLNMLLHTNHDKIGFFDQLADRILEYDVKKECYYAFFHTMIIYESIKEIAGYKDFLERIKPHNLDYLQEIINPSEKKVYSHSFNFKEWFSCDDRANLLFQSMNNQEL